MRVSTLIVTASGDEGADDVTGCASMTIMTVRPDGTIWTRSKELTQPEMDLLTMWVMDIAKVWE